MKIPSSKDIVFVGLQLLLFVIYFTPLFDLSFQLPLFFKFTLLIVAVAGLLIIIVAILQLNKNLTPFPTPKESGTLIQTGLYKYIRHPIYSGIILAALGFGLFHGNVWKISIGFTLWVLFYFKSVYEEKLLSKHFPGYGAYSKITNRFFPLP